MVPAEVRAAEEPRGLKENQNNLFFLFFLFFFFCLNSVFQSSNLRENLGTSKRYTQNTLKKLRERGAKILLCWREG